MYDLLNVLVNAKNKIIFSTKAEFEDSLNEIKQSDNQLILDWDDGAGEEWARLIHEKFGIVYMINSKIGIVFVRKEYIDNILKKFYLKYEICIVENYDLEIWQIDLKKMNFMVPQIIWHSSKEIVNPNKFSLNDLYFATI